MRNPQQAGAPRLINGPQGAAATVLLAHGAGAAMDSPFMTAIASGLAACDWRVVGFEFPYMARRRLNGKGGLPDRLPKLQEAFQQQINLEADGRPLIIGGKSMGGRVASTIADSSPDAGVCGCLCLGYPFHPPGKTQQLRTEHLAALRTPTLIVQGERDSFGRRAEVEQYTLAPAIELHWLACADHSFKPTRSSGLSEAGHWAAAVEAADGFIRRLLHG
jgi:uncharacterized protein